MIFVRAAQDWLQLLRLHRKASLLGFALGVCALLAAGTLWPKSYKGSALLAVNPRSLVESSSRQPAHQAAAELLGQTTSREDWAGIVTQYQLYPNLVADGGVARAASYLASQVSIEQIAAPEVGGEAVRIAYSGTDRDLILGVTNAVAEGFTRPTQSVMATPPAVSSEPLYAPVILPTPAPRASRHARAVTPVKKAGSRTPAVNTAVLSAKLQESLAQGVKLQDAFNQNASALDELSKQQRVAATPPPPAPKTPIVTERRNDLQEERLHQELATAQRTLADLRQRYTDEYPDVVAASQKVQDIQLDITRLANVAPRVARSQPAPKPETEAKTTVQDLAAIASQRMQAEAAQAKLQEAIARNQAETAKLQSDLVSSAHVVDTASAPVVLPDPAPVQPISPPTYTIARHPGTPQTAANAASSPFFLVQQASVSTTPAILARQFLLPLSLAFGVFAAFFAAWIAERRDPSIRNESMLRHELPASAVYLGGIPRIRHEVIAD